MIEVQELSKIFRGPSGKPLAAVDRVRLTVRQGEVFGLLGPNGAGKTTLLRMLCTLLEPTSGQATVAGFDVQKQAVEVRRHIGFLSANTGIYDRMTARELVEYYGQLYEIPDEILKPRIERLFGLLQLQDFRDTLGSKMSTGTKQKVSIARALVHDPPVIILDEPTAGLDVLAQRNVLENIHLLRSQGKTILFSSHIMREVEKVCDRVAILVRGRIVAAGSLTDLRQLYCQNDLEELFFQLIQKHSTER